MIELQGKYNTAKVFTDDIDEATRGQIEALLKLEFMADEKIRIMPDCHTGKGCVIGTTMTIHDKIVPNLVGGDIGCGMYAVKIKEKRVDLPKLDSFIKKNIPAGFAIREKPHKFLQYTSLSAIKAQGINMDRAERSLGTLGGGNHFIEMDKDFDGCLWLVIHTGSRSLGERVAGYYQNTAYEGLKDIGIPQALAYCTDELFEQYLWDMKLVQEFAYWNRQAIAECIISGMHLHIEDGFDTVHNYIDLNDMILRKGAISAQVGERVLIPMNMRDGSLICLGKGNQDWNFSAPHGAGRLMSRQQAKEQITLSAYKKVMRDAGVYSTSVTTSTIDEAPMAYKPMESILHNIEDTVKVVDIIKPIYNFKASEK